MQQYRTVTFDVGAVQFFVDQPNIEGVIDRAEQDSSFVGSPQRYVVLTPNGYFHITDTDWIVRKDGLSTICSDELFKKTFVLLEDE